MLFDRSFLEYGDQPPRRLQRVQHPSNTTPTTIQTQHNQMDDPTSPSYIPRTARTTFYDRPHHFNQEDYLPDDLAT